MLNRRHGLRWPPGAGMSVAHKRGWARSEEVESRNESGRTPAGGVSSLWPVSFFLRDWVRRPVKGLIFVVIVFFVLYPKPGMFIRHVKNVLNARDLPDPTHPGMAGVVERFKLYLEEQPLAPNDPNDFLLAVEHFVCQEIPYAWDWEVWGVADYLPTLAEVLEKGREDCDGRAVLAAALIRSLGIEARLVGDLRHIWVRTPLGDTMNPLDSAVFSAEDSGLNVRWAALLDPGAVAHGMAVFPLGRQVIVVLAAWVLLLPREVGLRRALLALLLLLAALMLIRLAGTQATAPNYAGIALGALHVVFATALLGRLRGDARVTL
jgi:hypothetical protein